MNYLAIKDNKGKGVYQYKTKEEKKEILKNLGLSQKAGKVFDNKNEALKYTNTKEVANREQRVVDDIDSSSKSKKSANTSTQKSNQNQILSTLELYRNKGYDFVEIEMSNGNKFDVVLNDFYYIGSNVIVTNRFDADRKYEENKYHIYIKPDRVDCSCYSINDSMIIFEDNYREVYVEKLYERLNKYNEYLDDRYNYDDYIKHHLNISDMVRYSHLTMSSKYKSDSFYKEMKKTKVDSVGDIIIFNEVFNLELVKDKDRYNSARFNYYLKENLINDYAVNSSHIVSLKPSKCSFKINDKDIISAIEEIEIENLEREKNR